MQSLNVEEDDSIVQLEEGCGRYRYHIPRFKEAYATTDSPKQLRLTAGSATVFLNRSHGISVL